MRNSGVLPADSKLCIAKYRWRTGMSSSHFVMPEFARSSSFAEVGWLSPKPQSPCLETPRVPNHKDAVGKGRVAMRSGAYVRHAPRPIAPHGDRIADRPEASPARKLKPW